MGLEAVRDCRGDEVRACFRIGDDVCLRSLLGLSRREILATELWRGEFGWWADVLVGDVRREEEEDGGLLDWGELVDFVEPLRWCCC